MTALDLQDGGPLDLAELAQACIEAGFMQVAVLPWGLNGLLPSFRGFAWKPGDEWVPGLPDPGLSADFAFALRDAVRAVYPCTYLHPTKATYRAGGGSAYLLYLRDENDNVPSASMPWHLPGRTETECWARALVALYRAGLLGKAEHKISGSSGGSVGT